MKLYTETYRSTYLLNKQRILFSFILVTVKKKPSRQCPAQSWKGKHLSEEQGFLTKGAYSAVTYFKSGHRESQPRNRTSNIQHTWMRSDKENSVLTVVWYCRDNSSEQVHVALYDIKVSLSITQRINCKHHNFWISWSRKIWKYRANMF